ncbi:hypothetical protein SLS60_011793 [Paraconiothyrium brasiliense]|uniref:Uncharacterized protein n=1 Tax=Paraconiothyrium brasiliense TaxID=300254 RepID=A0ABR3QHA2_9PLEO
MDKKAGAPCTKAAVIKAISIDVWFREHLAQQGVQVPKPELVSKHFIERLSAVARDYTIEDFVTAIAPHAAERRNAGQALDNAHLGPQEPRTLQNCDLTPLIEARKGKEHAAPAAKLRRLGRSRSSTPPSPEAGRGHELPLDNYPDSAPELGEGVRREREDSAATRSSPPPSPETARHSEQPGEDIADPRSRINRDHSVRRRTPFAEPPDASFDLIPDIDSGDAYLETVAPFYDKDDHPFDSSPARSDFDPATVSTMSRSRSKNTLRDFAPAVGRFAKQLDNDLAKHRSIKRKAHAVETEIADLIAPRSIDTAGLEQLGRAEQRQRINALLADENKLDDQIQQKESERDSFRSQEEGHRETLEEERRLARDAVELLKLKIQLISETSGDGDAECEGESEMTG